MSLIERLKDLSGAVAAAASDAPDDYPEWSYHTYAGNMEDIMDLWAQIRPQRRRDASKIPWIDAKFQEPFDAFAAGEKEKGRQAMWDLYNLEIGDLR